MLSPLVPFPICSPQKQERERMSCTKVIDLSLIEKICGDRNLTLEFKQSVFDN